MRAALPWAVTGGVLVLAGLGSWIVLGTGAFGVRDLRITGTAVVTPDEVRAAADVPHRVPLARVDLSAVGDRIAALPAVERAVVSRDWPATLVITVVERVPVAVMTSGDEFLVVDAAGVAFRTLSEPPAGLAVIRVPVSAPGAGDLLIHDALRVLAALTAQLREQLVEIDVEGPAKIILRLSDERIVVWGNATENETKARVADALLSAEGDTIDVSAPEVVTIR